MVNQAFRVMTEFRFDVGHAVAGSQLLQSEVGRISAAADGALQSFQRLGMGIVGQMGLGSGGIMGFFYKAIQSSDKFYQSQLKISNILQSNGMFEGANAFDQSMRSAERALGNMNKAAQEFSLPATDLANLSTQIGAVLTVKGLDDATLSKSIDISRQFLKSAPILGVDPGLATQQLVGAISGRAEMGSTLVQRMMDETTAMKPFSGQGGLKKFNALDPAKRLDVLTESLGQFSNNAKVTDSIAKSMSGQLRRLNDNLFSMFSILRPIGDALMGPIKMILETVNKYIETKGAKMAKDLAVIIERIFRNPEGLYIFLRQISQLKKDLTLSGHALFAVGLFHGLAIVMGFFGVKVGSLMSILGTGLRMIGGALFSAKALSVFGFALRAIGYFARMVLAPLGAFLFFFQSVSRAIAIADVANAQWLAENMDRITAVMARLSRALEMIFLPIEMAINGIANIIAWLFRLDVTGGVLLTSLEALTSFLEFLGTTVVNVLAVIQGAVWAIIEAMVSISTLKFKGLGGRMQDEFMAGFNALRDPFAVKRDEEEENAVSKRTVNIDSIEIINQFKEQMEPDRIAFTLVSQLEKIALNPQQAIGRSTGRNAIRN